MGERADAILIAGPTASGKSTLALKLAEQQNGVIINTDSMQVYPILRILTARPDDNELSRVPHHLYGHASLDQAYSVARWIDDVQKTLKLIKQSGKIAIFVGGTGLYFKALTEGLAVIPGIPADKRAYWRQRSQEIEGPELYAELTRRDPDAANLLKSNDRQRIVRALEVIDATGQSILAHKAKGNNPPILKSGKIEKYLLQPDREELYRRIEARFDDMVELGAIEEVKSLLMANISRDHPVLKAIGVPQFKLYLERKLTLKEACERCKIATRQYAKRQSTWFRNQLNNDWINYR